MGLHRRVAIWTARATALALVLGAAWPAAGGRPTADQVARATASATYQQHAAQFSSLYEAGRYDEALPHARAALEAAPIAEEPYVWVSKLSTLLGRDREAIELFKRTGLANPGLAWPWYYKGFNEYHQSLFDDALASFRRASTADPTHDESFYRQGMILYNKGEFAGAREALERAWSLNASSAPTAAQLVDVQRITGDYDAARATAQEALRRLPDSAPLLLSHGLILARDGDLPGAEGAFRRAIDADPRLRQAHQELARVLMRTKRRDEAKRELAIAGRLNDYERARDTLTSRIATSRSPGVPLLLAEVQLTGGEWSEAMRWFTRTQQMGLSDVRVAAGMAEAAFHMGNSALGDRILERLDGVDNGRVDLARAARALASGDREAAAGHAAAAARRGPDEREFLRRCADILARAGRVAESDALHAEADEAPELSSEADRPRG